MTYRVTFTNRHDCTVIDAYTVETMPCEEPYGDLMALDRALCRFREDHPMAYRLRAYQSTTVGVDTTLNAR